MEGERLKKREREEKVACSLMLKVSLNGRDLILQVLKGLSLPVPSAPCRVLQFRVFVLGLREYCQYHRIKIVRAYYFSTLYLKNYGK